MRFPRLKGGIAQELRCEVYRAASLFQSDRLRSGAQRGFVYLPGHDEQWYNTNTGSILRPNQDGRWNLADAAWCEQINAVIRRGR